MRAQLAPSAHTPRLCQGHCPPGALGRADAACSWFSGWPSRPSAPPSPPVSLWLPRPTGPGEGNLMVHTSQPLVPGSATHPALGPVVLGQAPCRLPTPGTPPPSAGREGASEVWQTNAANSFRTQVPYTHTLPYLLNLVNVFKLILFCPTSKMF